MFFERPGFYAQMLRSPWREHRGVRAARLALLIAASQVAHTSGSCARGWRPRERSAGRPSRRAAARCRAPTRATRPTVEHGLGAAGREVDEMEGRWAPRPDDEAIVVEPYESAQERSRLAAPDGALAPGVAIDRDDAARRGVAQHDLAPVDQLVVVRPLQRAPVDENLGRGRRERLTGPCRGGAPRVAGRRRTGARARRAGAARAAGRHAWRRPWRPRAPARAVRASATASARGRTRRAARRRRPSRR